MENPSPHLAVMAEAAAYNTQAQTLAQELSLPVIMTAPIADIADYELLLLVGDEGLSLQQTGRKAPGPVRVDFVAGQVAHRRKFGGGTGQQIAKAIGIKSGVRPRVADVTAGLGRDAFVLASLGCDVTLVERSAIIAKLLEDGLQRAATHEETADIVTRMQLVHADSKYWLEQQQGQAGAPQVVYVDPMFPHSDKAAEVKKEMRLFRGLIGGDSDADELLAAALGTAQNRVVVKRPRKAPIIAGPEPGLVLTGKSGRFDVYPLKALSKSQE